jgi:hypothetical protein
VPVPRTICWLVAILVAPGHPACCLVSFFGIVVKYIHTHTRILESPCLLHPNMWHLGCTPMSP